MHACQRPGRVGKAVHRAQLAGFNCASNMATLFLAAAAAASACIQRLAPLTDRQYPRSTTKTTFFAVCTKQLKCSACADNTQLPEFHSALLCVAGPTPVKHNSGTPGPSSVPAKVPAVWYLRAFGCLSGEIAVMYDKHAHTATYLVHKRC